MNKPAAIYARVSSDRQKENHTIAGQTAALIEYAQKNGYSVPPEWVFQDEGYSGAILVRPGLERLRDLAAEGQIAAVLVYSPDRLSRKYRMAHPAHANRCSSNGSSSASSRIIPRWYPSKSLRRCGGVAVVAAFLWPAERRA